LLFAILTDHGESFLRKKSEENDIDASIILPVGNNPNSKNCREIFDIIAPFVFLKKQIFFSVQKNSFFSKQAIFDSKNISASSAKKGNSSLLLYFTEYYRD